MKYLITSALPYINGVKHLGNIIGSLLPADVYARFLKQQGAEVLFICGTDEHGTPAEIAAQEEGLDIQTYCEKMYFKQKEIYNGFNIQFDYFGRSSSETNKKLTKKIFLQLENNGFITEKNIEQVYSIDDKRFLPDRYVNGTCPHCKYEKARGDQCDQCGRLLDPTDLLNPQSSISGSFNLEIKKERHLFFEMAKLELQLKSWLVTNIHKWPAFAMSVAKKWLTEGLQARCISRDLDWGVPIPKNGYENKVFYVWFDAPMAYISITQDWAKEVCNNPNDWERWWKKDLNETTYVQFMAKDNLPFHSIMWPAMLFGTGDNWKTVDFLKGFHWLTYEGGKFSTSLQRGIFSDTALNLFSADYWRYYLLANTPESHDSDFRLKDFVATINKDLVGTLGNFVNRVSALLIKYFDNCIPNYKKECDSIQQLECKCNLLVRTISKDFYELNFRSIMRGIRELWCLGNEFITENQPWKLINEDKAGAGHILVACLHLMRLYAIISYPVIPTSSEKIFTYLDLKDEKLSQLNIDKCVNFSCLEPNKKLGEIGLLFEKITPEREEYLLNLFSSKQKV